MPRARWLLAVLVLVAVIGCRRGTPRGTVKVAAAADLSRAFTEVGKAFTARTGTPVVFTFGSSGLLAKQLAEGAPFDLYAAASRQYVTQVVDAGACDMAQIKTPVLGGVQNTVDSVLYCKRHGVEAYQGGTCNETVVSTRVCVHLAVAAGAHRFLAKPGMGFDEGYSLVRNEMERLLALLAARRGPAAGRGRG